ncbi:MAG TPA: glycosyltransferase [Pyrinomonadaceae bacterium]|nr:glycosyltransferase [Pyrinomonadaceae bacterium]
MKAKQDHSSERAGVKAVAYVLKGFPRLSEMFITSEIYRLEQLGMRLQLHCIKSANEPRKHDLVEHIKARPNYLPATSSLSATSLPSWLALHLGDFLPSLAQVLKKRPVGLARGLWAASVQSVRARRTFWSWPRKVYVKEFLQSAYIAANLLDSPDVGHIHAHFCHGATTVAWLASLMTGLPFSFTAHAKDIYCEPLNPAGLLKRKMRAASFVVTCTDANRDYLRQIDPKAAVHLIYHGLNAEFSELLKRPSASPATRKSLRALGVGRLTPKKGFDVFVEACGLLRKREINFEALIVGEPDEHEAALRKRIQALGLTELVSLPGPMNQSQLYEEYQRATTFCLPCRVLDNGDRDGLPNVLVEAMACGLPVITTAVSGIPEIIKDGVNGQLIPPDDPEALANALLRVEDNPSLAQRLSFNAQQTVRDHFDGDLFATQLAGLFRSVLT